MKRKKKLTKTTPRRLYCPHCGAPAIIRPASEIYNDPGRTDELYVCSNYPACKSYVRMHPGTRVPLGTLANGELRNLRIRAHRKFDQVWQSGIMDRNNAYRWMADSLGIPLSDAHIGMFGEYRCKELIAKCEKVIDQHRKASGEERRKT